MAWSQADLDVLKAAILAIASGTRTITVSYGGPPARSETYQAADLAELRALLAEMERSVSTGQGYRLVTTRKGV
jgi:hypothetical protein